jgi:hypothetical protein
MYGLERDQSHVAVPVGAEKKLNEMAEQLVGTDDLIAIYVPMNTPPVYGGDDLRGKVAGAVQLVEMPVGKSTGDFVFKDLIDGSLRWPTGWPCQVVFFPPSGNRFDLGPLVELVHGAA